MKPAADPKLFWDEKILTWEQDRYSAKTGGSSLLECFANQTSKSLRFRQTIAKKLLRPFIGGKRVVELGCGSGLLAVDIIAMGATSYQGYDISENAVNHARSLATEHGISDKARFGTAAVKDLQPLETDIVLSLGLLDWLDTESLDAVFKVGGQADYLHTISEKRATPSQWLHRLYVYLSYGRKTGGYVPRYYTTEELDLLIRRHNPTPIHVYRHPQLSFGTLISSLPIDR